MKNLEILTPEDYSDRADYFNDVAQALGGNFHATTVSEDVEDQKILAGFAFIQDRSLSPQGSFLLVFNAEAQDKARDIADALAEQNPERKIVAAMYEEGVEDLFAALSVQSSCEAVSLFGVDPEIVRIEGAGHFQSTYGFSFPKDGDVLGRNFGLCQNQSELVQVFNLTQELNPFDQTYMNAQTMSPLMGTASAEAFPAFRL